MKKIIIISLIFVTLIVANIFILNYSRQNKQINNNVSPSSTSQTPLTPQVEEKIITNFTECLEAGFPIMESYPRQCKTTDNKNFIEDIGNELNQRDQIILENIRPNQIVTSPLTITGQARGTWFFEASFPIVLTDWDGIIIASGIATAKSDWMTEEFVAFEATLTFDTPTYKNNGHLILKKDNPSGLPEYDATLEIPVLFDMK
ncbi:MAG: Gmad2 immunoglobulin-like domain-containing protein [Candidatus Magasanikbacteria bacterium]